MKFILLKFVMISLIICLQDLFDEFKAKMLKHYNSVKLNNNLKVI